jgi:hypothetical protein
MRKKYPAYFTNPCGFLLSMKHRGEIVEKAITQSNVPISAIARAIGYDRRSIYNFFDNPDLSLDIIVKIGKAINYDFRKDFPELFIQEPKQAYLNASKKRRSGEINIIPSLKRTKS